MQNLVMTPQLQMAIRLLQLSTRELLDELPKLVADTPALSFSPRAPLMIGPYPPEDQDPIPEVYAYRDRDRIAVEANSNAIPEFAISGDRVLISLDPNEDPPEQPVTDRAAFWTVRAIGQRSRTYVKIISSLAYQGCFSDPSLAPVPIKLKEIADQVGMHESTIQRVLSGDKVLRCECGLIRLDAFLPKSRRKRK